MDGVVWEHPGSFYVYGDESSYIEGAESCEHEGSAAVGGRPWARRWMSPVGAHVTDASARPSSAMCITHGSGRRRRALTVRASLP